MEGGLQQHEAPREFGGQTACGVPKDRTMVARPSETRKFALLVARDLGEDHEPENSRNLWPEKGCQVTFSLLQRFVAQEVRAMRQGAVGASRLGTKNTMPGFGLAAQWLPLGAQTSLVWRRRPCNHMIQRG